MRIAAFAGAVSAAGSMAAAVRAAAVRAVAVRAVAVRAVAARAVAARAVAVRAVAARAVAARAVAARAVAATAVALLGGCCGVPPPPAEKFFDRTSPEATLKGFVYAVDAHQWDYAYESLSTSTRDEIGAVKFQVGIRYLREPETDVPLFDLISNALELRRPERSESEAERVLVVISKGHDSNGALVFVKVRLYFGLEDGEWRLDLMRSLGGDPGAGPPPDLSLLSPPPDLSFRSPPAGR